MTNLQKNRISLFLREPESSYAPYAMLCSGVPVRQDPRKFFRFHPEGWERGKGLGDRRHQLGVKTTRVLDHYPIYKPSDLAITTGDR
jgi:hypothetical protein